MNKLKICPFLNSNCISDVCILYESNECVLKKYLMFEIKCHEDIDIDSKIDELNDNLNRKHIESLKKEKAEEKKLKILVDKYIGYSTEELGKELIDYIRNKEKNSPDGNIHRLYASFYERDFWALKGIDTYISDVQFRVKLKEVTRYADNVFNDERMKIRNNERNVRLGNEKAALQKYIDQFMRENPNKTVKITKHDVELFMMNNNIQLLNEVARLLYLNLKSQYK